jgi:hypothetical protein
MRDMSRSVEEATLLDTQDMQGVGVTAAGVMYDAAEP